MEITREMQETLEKLSKVNLDFIEFVKKNPETLKRSNFRRLDSSGYTYKLQSWPTFINLQTKELFLEMAVKVCSLIKSIPARLFDNDPKKIAAYYKLPVTVVKLQLEGITHEHLANMVGRADFTFSPLELKCLEFNITPNSSGWQLPEWESLYLSTPIIEEFLKEHHIKINNGNYLGLFLDHIIRFASHLAAPDSNSHNPELNVALVVGPFDEDLQDKNPLLQDLRQLYNEKLSGKDLKGNLFMCDYPHLECFDNIVYLKGKRIHALIELFHGLVKPGVMRAYTDGNIRIINGPMTGLLLNKLNLALLSEHEESDLFSSEEKETIKKYIPWTRKIIPGENVFKGEKIIMENFLISNKDRLVIKPSIGLGGQRVYIGQDTFRKQWENLVNTALHQKNFLVQELVEAPRGLYQLGEDGCALHDTVWGVWILGSQYGASFVRALPGGNARRVVNGAQGAEISAVFEVEQ
jgi:hypothetical protein